MQVTVAVKQEVSFFVFLRTNGTEIDIPDHTAFLFREFEAPFAMFSVSRGLACKFLVTLSSAIRIFKILTKEFRVCRSDILEGSFTLPWQLTEYRFHSAAGLNHLLGTLQSIQIKANGSSASFPKAANTTISTSNLFSFLTFNSKSFLHCQFGIGPDQEEKG
jgi:hypothetical protein